MWEGLCAPKLRHRNVHYVGGVKLLPNSSPVSSCPEQNAFCGVRLYCSASETPRTQAGLDAFAGFCIVAPTGRYSMKKSHAPKKAPAVSIDGVIYTIRGERVILDADLAKIYGVETRVLNQAVRRNRDKFPPDFLLELTNAEAANLQRARKQEDTILRSQIVTLKQGHHLKYRPYAFTEHGALMAANILNSPQATQMSVFVIRAFVKMRGLLTDTRELAKKLAALETELKSRLDTHETAIVEVLQRILLLLDPPPGPDVPAKLMGFHTTMPKPAKR